MARLQKKKTVAGKAKNRETGAGEISSTQESDSKDTENKAKVGVVSAKSSVAAARVVPTDPNFIQKGMQFFREVRMELKKVTWPNRKQTAGSTVVVIVLVFVLAVFLGLVDFSLSKLVQVVLA